MSDETATSKDVLERLSGLYVAVVSDMLDEREVTQQVMASRIRPLFKGAAIAGRAVTARVETFAEDLKREEAPYQGHIDLIDNLTDGDVLVFSTPSGPKNESCSWGELMSAAAQFRGARGVVIDGFIRDVDGVERLQFPAFVSGVHASDFLGRGHVAETHCEIMCGEVLVAYGDYVLADADGVVVIPSAIASQVIAAAEQKLQGERTVLDDLRRGMTLNDAWERHGIL